jgi:hypothetical protein
MTDPIQAATALTLGVESEANTDAEAIRRMPAAETGGWSFRKTQRSQVRRVDEKEIVQ